MNKALPESRPHNTALTPPSGINFNFGAVLKGRATSPHTHRAYARWIDRYLVDMTDLHPATGKARKARMEVLPLDKLVPVLNPTSLRAWLGRLAEEGQGKQSMSQARASIITLASLLAEAGILDDYTSAAMTNVKMPKVESGQRQGRWLSVEQVRNLMTAAEDIACSPAQRARNALAVRMLCIMALRREELTEIRWRDLHTQAGRPVLLVHGKGSKAAIVDIPTPVLRAIERWVPFVAPYNQTPYGDGFLIRRVYKGGVVTDSGITADAIWRIVTEAARHAGLGKVAPHDLRRSVAGNLELSGVPVETISRLLRHSSIAVTQHYLSRLPRQNEGALLMADLLDMPEED
jgi:integrase/recombinase XerD